MPPLLSLRQISKIFPGGKPDSGKLILENIGLDIAEGETLGIMGKSGTGKTTLGKIIAGLEPATSGKVKFRGIAIHNLSSREHRNFRFQVQMMFQDPEGALNPKKTISRTLKDCRLLTGLPSEDHDRLIRKSLDQVGLTTDLLHFFPWQLSGGINQRVSLARILMVNPRVIVLDEPTSALDLSVQAQILRLLKTVQQKRGISYVFISHDMSVVRWMSHRIGLLADHRLSITLNSHP